MSEVFCRNCGSKISAMAVICTHCGVATGYRDVNQVIGGPASPELKSVGLAFLFTFLFPGAGHLYIGKSEKGMPYMIANAIGFVCALTLILLFIGIIIWLVTFIMLAPKITQDVEEVNREILSR